MALAMSLAAFGAASLVILRARSILLGPGGGGLSPGCQGGLRLAIELGCIGFCYRNLPTGRAMCFSPVAAGLSGEARPLGVRSGVQGMTRRGERIPLGGVFWLPKMRVIGRCLSSRCRAWPWRCC